MLALPSNHYINLGHRIKSTLLFSAYLKCPDGIGNPFILLRLGECFYELDNLEKAKDYLIQAYMCDGAEIFEDEDEKYKELISGLL